LTLVTNTVCIAIELFAKWLAEQEAAQQSVQPTGLRAWSKEELAKALSIGQEESGENASGLRKPLAATLRQKGIAK